jgi:ubiquinone/menaquinone biosynthesis C-methylase UbiE
LSKGLHTEKDKVTTYTEHTITADDFEKIYIRLRKLEGRIYSDKEVANLPEITETHPHYSEWQVRKESSQKLIAYLKKRKQTLSILEIGCGNGWLAAQLAAVKNSKVTGIDINTEELEQAKRVFKKFPNLQFYRSGINELEKLKMQFDVIVFAAAIQYFPSLQETISLLLKYLRPGGEIHVIDSPFYSLPDLSAARQRSMNYYQLHRFPEMTNWYFHHKLDDQQNFNYSVRYNPNSLFNKFLHSKNPFYWICINV